MPQVDLTENAIGDLLGLINTVADADVTEGLAEAKAKLNDAVKATPSPAPGA
jgi:hypothetical protein